jgi:amino acid adenylation domain-containing protein
MRNTEDLDTSALNGGQHSDKERLLHLMLAAERKRQRSISTIEATRKRDKALPLSHAQERLWFLEQLGLVGAAYNLPWALRVSGELVELALERSFAELIRRHESLRTRYQTRDGVPEQVVDPPGQFKLLRANLDHLADPQVREEQLRECMRRERSHRFDLAEGPVLRAMLVKLGVREHVLLITIHHIAADGWSFGVLLDELSQLYSANICGAPSPLPDLPLQYADYAVWQRQWLSGEVLERQLEYWKERLGGAPPELHLPIDRRRPALESFKGAAIRFELGPEVSRGLQQLARRLGMTLFMVCLAAYQVLIARWSGQYDVVVGSPIAGRRNREVEGLIGNFVNTLALRTDVSGAPTFLALLERVKEVTLGAYAHQDLPFEALVHELRPERDLSRQAIFQVWLALQNYPQGQLELPNLTLSWTATEWNSSHFDLALYLSDHEGGLSAEFEYATDLFESETIRRLARNFQTLLQGILANPAAPVDELPLLSDTERQQLLAWNSTAAPYRQDCCLHDLFLEQVARSPEALAVLYEGSSLTYAELNRRANRLARYLRGKGVGPDGLVGICVERSLEMVVGLLGILKAGGAYVPLDPHYPMDRLAYILQDAAPRVLLIQGHLRTRLPRTAAELVALDDDWELIAKQEADDFDSRTSRPHHLAYVIYTSGSTGKPKGAMNEHRALVNRLQWMQQRYQLDHRDRVLQKTPFSFDVSVWEFFWTLMTGSTLVVSRPQGHQDPEYLRKLIDETSVTVLHFVPSMLQTFLDQYQDGHCVSLRHVICSGEELPVALQRKFFELLPNARLHNLYGPTEAAIDVTSWECLRGDESPRVPIGRPIANIQMYVLDQRMQLAPIGVTGEIYIGGIGVGRGYLNRPELTAERFIADPFSADPQARLYKTGDLGRWRADAALEYLGRNDYQVKIRGFRIELAEIEARLACHAQVKEAVVVAREDVVGDRRLVAYLTTRDQLTPGLEDLRAHLAATLPEYMVPAAFVILDSLPLSPNGKLDRRALPAPQLEAFASRQYEAPEGETEQTLAEIWQELLQLERVGRSDNFFELGGHSLHGIKLIASIAARIGVRLSVIALFQHPTIGEMAAAVDSLRPSQPQSVDTEFEEGTI